MPRALGTVPAGSLVREKSRFRLYSARGVADADVLLAVFFATDFFATFFVAAVFFAATFVAAVLFAPTFFAADFVAVAFFVAAFRPDGRFAARVDFFVGMPRGIAKSMPSRRHPLDPLGLDGRGFDALQRAAQRARAERDLDQQQRAA